MGRQYVHKLDRIWPASSEVQVAPNGLDKTIGCSANKIQHMYYDVTLTKTPYYDLLNGWI